MKRSTGCADLVLRVSVGTDGLLIGRKDQCSSYSAPCFIQSSRIFFCFADSRLPVSGGGMSSSLSSLCRRNTNSLSSGFPGTTAVYPPRSLSAPSDKSSRRFASRVLLSGPWQWKQYSERMGRTSLVKSTFE